MYFLDGSRWPSFSYFRIKWSACAFLVVLASSLSTIQTQGQRSATTKAHHSNVSFFDEVTTLSVGQPTTRQIKGGERQLFQVGAGVGQFIRIAVRPTRIIVQVTLFDPAGKQLVTTNNPSGGTGPIFVSEVAAIAGDFKLEIRSPEAWANAGTVEISVAELRTASPDDAKLIEAERSFAKALQESDARAYPNAVEHYQKALPYWQSIHDTHWEALTHYALGQTYYLMRNLLESDNSYNKVLGLLLNPDDWRIKAAALNDLGLNARIQGKNEKAITHLNEAFKLFEDHGDRRGQASSLNNLAGTYGQMGDLRVALSLVERALPLREAENFQSGVNTLRNALGNIYDKLGDPYKAVGYHKQALAGWQQLANAKQLDNPDRLGNAFNGVAIVSAKVGQWDKAAQSYEDALKVPDISAAMRAAILNNRAEFYASLGDFASASKDLDDAKALVESLKAPEADIQSSILWQMAQINLATGEIEKAVSLLEQARGLKQNRPKRAYVLTALGEGYSQQGKLDEAQKAYQEALDIQLKIEDLRGQALTRLKLGQTLAGASDLAGAAAQFESALSLWKAVIDPRGEAATLNSMASLERDRNNLTQALHHSEQATQILESLRTSTSIHQLRTSYFATHENYYELNIDLKMKARGPENLASALAASEKSRARSLLDTLAESHIALSRTANDAIVRSQSEIAQRLQSKFDAQTVLKSSKHKEAEAKAIADEIVELIKQQDEIHARVRNDNPKFLELTHPRLLSVPEIQKELDTDTLLLEYALGEKRSYVWVVSPKSIHGFELPSRVEIETAAGSVTAALTARNREEKNETFAQKVSRVDKAEKDYVEASAILSKMVLDPVAQHLKAKRLVIVADGALQMVPFAALPVPANAGSRETVSFATTKSQASYQKPRAAPHNSKPVLASANPPAAPALIKSYEIVTLPSASVLALQRRELKNRTRAPHAVAVLADPVFDLQDERVAAAAREGKNRKNLARKGPLVETPKSSDESFPVAPGKGNERLSLSAALRDIGLDGTLPRLSRSRQEAMAITRAAPGDQSFSALDFKASRQTATSSELSKYQIVHFATHGFLNLEHPELSGIVLSMVDEKGQSQDGYLRLHEIYNLNLPAELVVLSACQTGVGKQIKGEGLIALTRGFMYAGARSVVASLWKVDDAATAELMAEFYKQMFTNKLKPAAALQAAQVRMSEQRRWQSPYYWAGFFLQGEWN